MAVISIYHNLQLTTLQFCRSDKENIDYYHMKDNGLGFKMNYTLNLLRPSKRQQSITNTWAYISTPHLPFLGCKISEDAMKKRGAVFYFTVSKSQHSQLPK